MRSRTEMVTTTFVDSEDEESAESDDSEEDWKPDTERTVKKRKQIPRPPKRKQGRNAARFESKRKRLDRAVKSNLSDADDKNAIFELYVDRNDLKDDYKTNTNLCLWRRDTSGMLQKYIRVKRNRDEFVFTSSSVYSSWSDKRRQDFSLIRVKHLEENNRCVTILDLSELEEIARQVINEKQTKSDDKSETSDEKEEPEEDEDEDENDDDNEDDGGITDED